MSFRLKARNFMDSNRGKILQRLGNTAVNLIRYSRNGGLNTAGTGVNALQNDVHSPFGLTNSQEALRYWRSLYNAGTTLKCNYRVIIEPYNNNTAHLPIFSTEVGFPVLGFLATDVEFPVLGLSFEQKRFGAFNFSRFNEYNFSSFTISFLETKNQAFLRSLVAYRDLVVSNDGTASPPAKYALKVSVKLYGNGLMENTGYALEPLVVAISLDNLTGLTSSDFAPLDIPITFNVLSLNA